MVSMKIKGLHHIWQVELPPGKYSVSVTSKGLKDISRSDRAYYALKCSHMFREFVDPDDIVIVRIKEHAGDLLRPFKDLYTIRSDAEKFASEFEKIPQPVK